MKDKLIILLLSALTLSSCKIYSKFHQESTIDSIDSLYNYINAQNDTTTIASLSWKAIFEDPYLQTLIEEGLTKNTNLNVARLNLDQAEIVLQTARLAFLPSLTLSANGNANSVPTSSYTISGSASWELDFFGKLRNAKEQKKAELEKSRAYKQVVQTQLIATIANSYYSLLMLDSQLEISNQTLKAWDENIRTMEALKQAGRLNQVSVLQAKANKVALQSKTIAIEKQLADLDNSLSALLMRIPSKIERGQLDQVSFPNDLAIGLPYQLLSSRPDIRMAEYNLKQAFYETNVARSSLYPHITIGGTAGFSDGKGSILKPGEMLYSAVASLVQPIFNKGVLTSQLRISKSKQEQALLQFQQALLDAGVEVNQAMIKWQSASKKIQFDKEQISLLEKAVHDSELLMKYGKNNYLDVLTAQFSLLQAQLNNATNQFEEIQGVIDLYRSVGGGEN